MASRCSASTLRAWPASAHPHPLAHKPYAPQRDADPGGVRRALERPSDAVPTLPAAPAEITLAGRITERSVKQNGTTWLRFTLGDEVIIARGELAASWAKRSNGTPVIVTGVRKQDGRLGIYIEATAIRAGMEEAELPL